MSSVIFSILFNRLYTDNTTNENRLHSNDLKPDKVARVCQQLFSQDLDIFPGTILVIEESRIRIRHPLHKG